MQNQDSMRTYNMRDIVVNDNLTIVRCITINKPTIIIIIIITTYLLILLIT